MIIGIDPGVTGSLVLLNDDGSYVDHLLMPVVKKGKSSRVNGAAVAGWLAGKGVTHAYLESVQSMPKQGVASVFTFGHAAGLIEGVMTGALIPITLVLPTAWKKSAGLIGTDKDAARSRAVQLYPHIRELDLKGKGQALADSILIARHGLSLASSGSVS
ncbi:hypothetical protein D3C78_654560 [compost metagenome]